MPQHQQPNDQEQKTDVASSGLGTFAKVGGVAGLGLFVLLSLYSRFFDLKRIFGPLPAPETYSLLRTCLLLIFAVTTIAVVSWLIIQGKKSGALIALFALFVVGAIVWATNDQAKAKIYETPKDSPKMVGGSASVRASIPPNGGPPGSNTAFFEFADKDINLDSNHIFKAGPPSYVLVPADGDYHVEAVLAAPYEANRLVADYMSFALLKMAADKTEWETLAAANDYSRVPRANLVTSAHLQRGDKLALRAGNAAGVPIFVGGTFSVQQLN